MFGAKFHAVHAGIIASLLLGGCATISPPATPNADLALPAFDPTAFRSPVPGTVYFWKREAVDEGKASAMTFEHVVTAAEGHTARYTVRHESREPTNDEVRLFASLFSYAFWRPRTGWGEFRTDHHRLAGLWPLRPGQAVTITGAYGFGAGTGEAAARARWRKTEDVVIAWRVLREEAVTIPAGTFRTIVIAQERSFRRVDRRPGLTQSRLTWLSPQLGWLVRQTEITRRDGVEIRRSTIELQKVVAPPAPRNGG